ncbi:MAG TPA: polyphenol oxidase family protein [Gemmatimonadales bacterium]|nr:polyphenol oxidase family protein [Gemmatimonadales bacterium]
MPDAVAVLSEQARPGEVPRFELDEWAERFGVTAGITARGDGPGRGFDLGLWTDAPAGEVMGRWRAFRSAIPGFTGVVLGTQVHRTEVVWHDRLTGWVQLEGVDGHATATPGLLLTVTVADCIPVYLVAPEKRAIALLHAGWRGTAGGILKQGVEVLRAQANVQPSDLVMHCGVGICGSCYEVGPEVLEALGLRGDDRGPWHVDLRERLAEQAEEAGIAEVTVSSWCSGHHRPLFYSHRASHGTDGRMVAYLGMPASVDEAGPGR